MKLVCAIASLLLGGLVGCETEDPTTIVVDNDHPAIDGGGDAEITVFEAWWGTSLLPDPVAPGAEGAVQRAVLGTDFAYALLAPGWTPASGAPPSRLIPVKSSSRLTVARGDRLHVHVSDATFAGNCAAGAPLSQEDADFITQRIFPGAFAGFVYDASTCVATPAGAPADAAGPP